MKSIPLDARERPNGWDKTLLVAMVALSLFVVTSSVAVVLWTFHVIPVQDHWVTVDLYRAYLERGFPLDLFWSQHNEHRIVLPRFFFLLDFIFAHGSQWLVVPALLILQSVQAWLFGRAFRREVGISRGDHIFFAGVAFALLFWLIQSGNLIWGFQITWTLNALFASIAAWLVCGLERDAARAALWKSLALAALCCVLATYSLANGIFMAGILLVWVWKVGLPRGAALAWLLFCIALGLSYLAGYHSPENQASSPLDGIHFGTLHYLVVYLGNPISRLYQPAGTALGILGLVLFFFFVRRVLVEKQPSFYLRFGVAQLSYVVVTAVVTALGRSGEGIAQAASSRYFTTGLIFWFFQLTLVYGVIGSTGKFARPFRAALVAIFLFFLIPVQIAAIPHREKEFRRYDDGALALITGVQDSTTLLYLNEAFTTDSLSWARSDFLKQHRLSIFHEPSTQILGKEFGGYAPALKGEVRILRTLNVPGREGYFVEGTLAPQGVRTPQVVLFVREGDVVGYAHTVHRPCRGCFSGYVRGLENRDFEIFALNTGSGKTWKIIPNP